MGGQYRQRCRRRCRPLCQSVHQGPGVLSAQNARARGRFDRRKAHTSRKKGKPNFWPPAGPAGPSARRTDGRRGDCARSGSIAGREGARPIVANPSTASSSSRAYSRSISRDIRTAGACEARCVEVRPTSEKGDITTISARSALRGVLREASVFEPEGFSDSPSQAHRARAVRRFARACRARTLTSPTELNYLGGGTQTNTGGVPPKERNKQTKHGADQCGIWHDQ